MIKGACTAVKGSGPGLGGVTGLQRPRDDATLETAATSADGREDAIDDDSDDDSDDLTERRPLLRCCCCNWKAKNGGRKNQTRSTQKIFLDRGTKIRG